MRTCVFDDMLRVAQPRPRGVADAVPEVARNVVGLAERELRRAAVMLVRVARRLDVALVATLLADAVREGKGSDEAQPLWLQRCKPARA